MSLKRQSASKGDDYVPAVPSPLNPTAFDSTQHKNNSTQRRRIRVVGRGGSKQSPTEILLRYKAALAFQDHAAAVGRMKGLVPHRELPKPPAPLDLSVRRSRDDASSKPAAAAKTTTTTPPPRSTPANLRRGSSRSSGRSSARYAHVSKGVDTADLVLRLVATARDAGSKPSADRTGATTSSTTAGVMALDDEKTQAPLADMESEFLVDFSGVTIDNLTTAVLMEQSPTLMSGATPARMLWVLALVSLLIILVFIRLQALSARYLMMP